MSSNSYFNKHELSFNYIVVIKSLLFFFACLSEFKWVLISFAVTSVHCLQHHTKSKPTPLNHLLYLLFCCLINSLLSNLPAMKTARSTWKPWQSLMGKFSQQWWNKALSEAASSRTRTKKCCAILTRPENSIHPIKNPLPALTPCSYLSHRRRTVEGLFSGWSSNLAMKIYNLLLLPAEKEFCCGESIYPLIVTLIFFFRTELGPSSWVAAPNTPSGYSVIHPRWASVGMRILPVYYTVRPGSDGAPCEIDHLHWTGSAYVQVGMVSGM